MDENLDNASVEAELGRLLEKYRDVHLNSFESQRKRVLRKRRRFREGFERRIRQRWGAALDEYEVIIEIALMMWWHFNKRWFRAARAAKDHKTISLIDLDARCLRVA